MSDESDTTFRERTRNFGQSPMKNRTVIAGGTGLSAAAVIWIYATFPTKGDVERCRQAQTTQWQQIGALRTEVHELRLRNHAYEKLLEYVTSGTIRATNGRTNL